MTRSFRRAVVAGLTAAVAVVAFQTSSLANHSWNGYHWARRANPFTVQLGDNVSIAWDAYLTTAAADWSRSTVLDSPVVDGQSNKRNCRPTSGRVEVCNAAYGANGWLGIAQVWVSGSHITQGTVKMNDTYFSTTTYNTPAWRQFVVCQEVGHTFGLDHQDENFNNANLGTCMDYTSDPDGDPTDNDPPSNEHPNAHDFAQLETIYSHLDSTTTIDTSATATAAAEEDPGNDPRNWGRVMERDGEGRPSLFGKDLAPGEKLFTFVIYAEGAQEPTVDDGTSDPGTGDSGTGDHGKQDGGKKADSKQDGGKKDGGGKHRHGKHHR
jgi:hypothetical protein